MGKRAHPANESAAPADLEYLRGYRARHLGDARTLAVGRMHELDGLFRHAHTREAMVTAITRTRRRRG